jgi:hypothetical protein
VQEYNVKVGPASRVNASIDVRFKDLLPETATAAAPTIMQGQFIAKKVDSKDYVNWNSVCEAPALPLPPFAAPDVITTEEPAVTPIVKEQVTEKPLPFTVRVYPNPFSVNFSIIITSASMAPVTLRILDVSGNQLSVMTNLVKGSMINLGTNLRGGTYFAEVSQGTHRQVLKLVKLN